jgi:membrane protein
MDARPRLDRGWEVARAVYTEVRAENITFLAGSIAYHAFVSLLPFLLLVLVVVSRFGGQPLAEDVLLAMAGYLTPDFRRVLVEAATNATSSGLSLVGLAVLVWGTLRIFRGLDQAFSDIYESEAENTFLDQLVDGVVVFGAIGLAIFAVSLFQELVGFPSFGPFDPVARPTVSVVGISVALLPMYYVFPDEEGITVREVVPGALVAGTGWTALSLAFGLYVETSSATSYGIVGVVVLLITWLYFAGLALLTGAAVNAVLAGRSEDVADIAWGRRAGDSPADNDAPFVAPLRELEAADWANEVHVRVGDREVTLPEPDEVTVRVATVERPRLLGGDEERGRIRLSWDSKE